jgi:hypothetical protein
MEPFKQDDETTPSTHAIDSAFLYSPLGETVRESQELRRLGISTGPVLLSRIW